MEKKIVSFKNIPNYTFYNDQNTRAFYGWNDINELNLAVIILLLNMPTLRCRPGAKKIFTCQFLRRLNTGIINKFIYEKIGLEKI